MTHVERLTAAIETLTALADDAGPIVLTADGWLLARADDDTDDDGNRFMFGLNIMEPGVGDYDESVANALAVLARTIEAQLGILQHALGRAQAKVAGGGKESVVWSHERDALALADAILGGVK